MVTALKNKLPKIRSPFRDAVDDPDYQAQLVEAYLPHAIKDGMTFEDAYNEAERIDQVRAETIAMDWDAMSLPVPGGIG